MSRQATRRSLAVPSSQGEDEQEARLALANRLFFRLYQCANMLHKTGSRAVEAEGLTTQQWAVLGAISRPEAAEGMGINELARYLMVSRQNLSGLVSRMEAAGHLRCESAPDDRRSRLVRLTPAGRRLWQTQALPKIHAYYGQVLEGFSVNDSAHALHYLLKILDNMKRLDDATAPGADAAGSEPSGRGPGRAGRAGDAGRPAKAQPRRGRA